MEKSFIDFIVTYKNDSKVYCRMTLKGFIDFLKDNIKDIKNIYLN